MRIERELTQQALMERTGISVVYISKLENDVFPHSPSLETIGKLVTAMDLSMSEHDELCVLAGRIPADVERILLENPKLFALIRKRSNK